MSFNNYADTNYHEHKEFDRLFKVQDSTLTELTQITRELGELTKVIESLFSVLDTMKKDIDINNKRTIITNEKHEVRIASLERYRAKMNTTAIVISTMVTIGGILLGYKHYFG